MYQPFFVDEVIESKNYFYYLQKDTKMRYFFLLVLYLTFSFH